MYQLGPRRCPLTPSRSTQAPTKPYAADVGIARDMTKQFLVRRLNARLQTEYRVQRGDLGRIVDLAYVPLESL